MSTNIAIDGHEITVPADQYKECSRLAIAITAAGRELKAQIDPKLKRVESLRAEIRRRRPIAQSLKLGTLACGGLLVTAWAPEYSRYIGAAIIALSILDWVFGNHRRLLNAHDELEDHEAIVDLARGLSIKWIDFLVHVGAKPREALEAYLEYLRGLLTEVQAGTVDLRKRVAERERALSVRLALPEPTAAMAAEGDATTRRSE